MKTLTTYLFVIALFITNLSNAQILKTWDKTLAGGDTESPVLINKNDDGTIDIIATIRNSGNDVTLAYGGRDFWFCRLNSNGQVLLNSTYGGSLDDFCTAALPTADGGYLLTGVSASGADGIKSEDIPAGNLNVGWVVKIDHGGQVQWQKQIAFGSGVAPDFQDIVDYYEGYAVCKTSIGYSLMYSVTTRKLSTNEYGPYYSHCVNLDQNGNITKNSSVVPTNFETSNKIYKTILLANGNILGLGYGYKGGDKNKKIGLAVEYTLSAVVKRVNEFTSSGDCEILNGKELSPDGDRIYFASSKHDNSSGFSRTAPSKSTSVANETDLWVFKSNSIGTNLFDQRAIGCNGDVIYTTFYNPLRNVYFLDNKAHLLLDANQVGGDKTENPKGKYDYWYVIYDMGQNGIVKEKSFGGTEIERVNSLYVDQQNCYMLGTSQSGISTTVGDKSESVKSGVADLWVVKACTSVDMPEILNSTPVNGINTISGCINQNLTVQIKNPNTFYTYAWYDAATGGNLLGKGATYTVNIAANKDIWVQTENGACTSGRVQTKIIMNPTPNKPTILGKSIICRGSTLTLTAQKDLTPPNQNSTSIWYDSTGTNVLSTQDILSIANLNYSGKILLSSKNGSCESNKDVFAFSLEELPKQIIPFFTNPDCIYNSTNISVKNPPANTTIKWLDGKNNYYTTGNPIDYTNSKMIDTLKSIIVSANGCESDPVINYVKVTYPRPNKPIIKDSHSQPSMDIIYGCSDHTKELEVKYANNNFNYNWYDAATGGNLIIQNSIYTTPKLNGINSYEYWVETNDNYCVSERKMVKVNVIHTAAKPKVTILNPKVCRGDQVSLIADKEKNTNPQSIFVTRWYTTNNILITTGDTLKIKDIKANQVIYCTTVDSLPYDFTTKLGPYLCESEATSINIMVDTVATPIVAYTTPSCVGSNIQFNVLNTNINGSVKWFTASGKLLGTSPTYKILNIQKNDTVICQAFGVNGCQSYKSTSIVNVEKPTAMFTSNKTSIEVGDIVLFENQSINGAEYFWNFGDNSTSTQKNPFHYFNNPGYFTIKLGVKAPNGCTDTLTLKDYIYVRDPNGIEELIPLGQVKVFPVPFTDKFEIILPNEINSARISVINELGQSVLSKIIYSSETINTTTLEPGFYYLQIQSGNATKTLKLVKS